MLSVDARHAVEFGLIPLVAACPMICFLEPRLATPKAGRRPKGMAAGCMLQTLMSDHVCGGVESKRKASL